MLAASGSRMPLSPRDRPRRLERLPRPRAGHVALLALAAGHAALSLALVPGWLFAKYPNLAAALRRGDLGPAQASDASPAYLLATLLVGPTALRWLQAVAAAAAVLVAYRVAARLGGRVAGWVAAVGLALAQPWLLYGAVLEPDLAIGVLDLAAVACLASGSPRLRASAAAGAALGLSFALRPAAAPFALLALAWLFLGRRAAAPGSRPMAHTAALAAAFAAAALIPVSALYLRARQEWRATMSVGQVFHQGHRPEGSGVGATYPTLLKLVEIQEAARPHPPDYAHELYRRFASAAAGSPLPAPQAERYWMGKALAFASLEPAAFLRQLVRAWVFTVTAPASDADVPEVMQADQATRFPWIPMRWLALGGLGGLALSWRRGRLPRLLGLWVASYQLVYLVFYYQSRYGLAILPAWCCLLGSAAAAAWEARREPRRLALALLAIAAPFGLTRLDFVRFETRLLERNRSIPVPSEAVALRGQGRWAEARERFADEQASLPDYLWPWSPHGWGLGAGSPELARRAADRARARFGDESPVDAFLVAVLQAAGGRCQQALPLADRAAAAGFGAAIADSLLDPDLVAADCLLELRRPDEALARIRRSLRARPGTLDGLARAVAAAGARPDLAGGERERWEGELFALHDPASAHWALARARRRWSDPERALADADWVAARLPEAAPFAEFERALCFLDLGRPREALRAYARALPIRYYMHGTDRFDDLVRQFAASLPDDRLVAMLALSHWMRVGDLDEVRAIVTRHPDLARPAGAGAPTPGGG